MPIVEQSALDCLFYGVLMKNRAHTQWRIERQFKVSKFLWLFEQWSWFKIEYQTILGLPRWLSFPDSSAGKESACNAGGLGLIPGLGRSAGEGKGYPLQYSGLENSKDCIVYRVAKSRTWPSDFHSLTRLGGSAVKTSLANVADTKDTGTIPGWRRSPRIGNNNLLQYSCWHSLLAEEPGGVWSVG